MTLFTPVLVKKAAINNSIKFYGVAYMFFILLVNLLLFTSYYAHASAPIVYNVTIKDGVFTPSFINVPTKKKIKIRIKNIGTSPAEFENLSLIVEKTLGSGVESSAIIPPLRPGTYKFIDEFHIDMSGFTIRAK